MPLQGRCYCGAVHFEVEDAFEYAGYCHCQGCQRRTGSAFNTYAGITPDKIRVTQGAEHVTHLAEGPQGFDAYCRSCLSPLYSMVRDREYIHVRLGTLDASPSRKPDHHIYVAFKAPWHEITDDLPQFAELPPHD
ncbi:GFA family protein [Silvimonas iriomotensis]|uniref:Aldehyde-activating protein n=1 Tax=Silvimonas iriomotensis TaxID=449662 RepID=A0ABQ2PEW6_9NEIS|nr:GFA family protein [Silvimonas iriomotensis]GGP24109.1 aldehyde-activating protein [Silvimonas iriomotensis]